jgi:hypothetical protein
VHKVSNKMVLNVLSNDNYHGSKVVSIDSL